MRSSAVAWGLALCGVLWPSTAAAADEHRDDPLAAIEAWQQQMYTAIAPSVVFLSSHDGFGSGFFVSTTGLVLTNAHVVGDDDAVEVVTFDGRRFDGVVIERAADDVDLALVRIPVDDAPPLPLGDSRGVRVGAWVGSVGHGAMGIWTFVTGMVSNVYPDSSGKPVFQTQIPLNPGSSGGPIFDRNGRVIGVVTAGMMQANAINFGIKLEVALRTLTTLGDEGDCLVIEAPAGVVVFVDGAMAGTGPRVVVPATAGQRYRVLAVVNGRQRQVDVEWPETRRVDLR